MRSLGNAIANVGSALADGNAAPTVPSAEADPTRQAHFHLTSRLPHGYVTGVGGTHAGTVRASNVVEPVGDSGHRAFTGRANRAVSDRRGRRRRLHRCPRHGPL